MLHSQLKIRYPDCPFIWNYHDMSQIYSAHVERRERLDLYKEIIDTIVCDEEDKRSNRNPYYDRDAIEFLMKITDPVHISGVFDQITYCSVHQKVPKHQQQHWINFHTCAYHDDHDALISKEYHSSIAWCLLPIIGDVCAKGGGYNIDRGEPKPIRNDNGGDVFMDDDVAKAFNPNTYKGEIDNRFEKFEADIRCLRAANRHIIKRSCCDETKPVVKRDIMTNQEDVQITKHMEPRAKPKQIELNSNTRASASLIRERNASAGRVYRFRNNPEMFKHQMSVNLGLQDVSTSVAEQNNAHIIKNDKVERTDFDYIFEKVNILKVNGIFKFSPATTGNIIIHSHDDHCVYFVTVVRHKKNLHVTLHEVHFI